MLGVIAAERLKFMRHGATWGLVWIWPIGVTAIWLLGTFIAVAMGNPPTETTAEAWIQGTAGFWNVPGHTFGRYLLGSFVAVVFAGEYGWNTWKLIVPHQSRATLIAGKYAAAFGFLAVGFIAAAILYAVFGMLSDVVRGETIPAGVGLGGILGAHGTGALAALAPVLWTIAYVGFFAILTRSTVAALIIGLVITTIEELFRGLAPLLEPSGGAIVRGLTQVLPGYHLGNIKSVITTGEIAIVPFSRGEFSTPVTTSLLMVALWIAVPVFFTFRNFARQDLN